VRYGPFCRLEAAIGIGTDRRIAIRNACSVRRTGFMPGHDKPGRVEGLRCAPEQIMARHRGQQFPGGCERNFADPGKQAVLRSSAIIFGLNLQLCG
jgi:hypothetical protein